MKNVSDLLDKDHKEIESQIIEFIIASKEKGMKRGAISNYVSPVLSFCKINDIMVNTTKINKFMPAQVIHIHRFKNSDIAEERMRTAN
jgi:hypothetical protein